MRDKWLKRPLEILLVEDNPGDVRLTQEALRVVQAPNHLHVVKDGVEAMAFLHQEGAYSNMPRPNLVLLDLNLPRKDGREVLAEIKADPNLRRIPVLILTTSTSEHDVQTTYDLHANSYIPKPSDLPTLNAVIQSIDNFWLETAKLPS